MYPLLFAPLIKKMIWGEERWEISCRADAMSVVENGELAGKTLAELGYENFPLLVKTISARDTLSVQVHPDDDYARARGGSGKSELWYILEPPLDGEIILGLREGVTRESFARAIANATVEECLNRKKVSRGDIVSIPAGLVHALTPGTVVAEIQQNSDTTYRLYDFGRTGADGKPRELHIADALAVIDFENASKKTLPFNVREMKFAGAVCYDSNPRPLTVFTCVRGSAVFETSAHSICVPERRSVLIPENMGEFTIRAEEKATLLKSEPICPPSHNIPVKEFGHEQ